MNADDELNKIFRDGLSEPGKQAVYREADWDALEQMLDERKKRRGLIFWLPLASGIAALLLLFFGWMFLRPSVSDKQNPAVAIVHTAPLTVVKGDHSQQQAVVSKPQADVAVNTNPSSPTADNTVASVGDGAHARSSAVRHRHNPALAGHQNGILVSNHHPRKGKTGGNTETPGQTDGTILTVSNNNSPKALSENLYAANDFVIDQYQIGKPTLTAVDELFPRYIDKIIDPIFYPNRTHMAITVLAASTANGVGTFSDSKSGANVGALFSFGIRKFTLSTGAIYAKTPYGTDFSNYHTKYQFATAPLSVNADCRILDIPINLDYQFYNKRQNKFSVGAGLSSYLMLHEDYDYNYANPVTAGPYGYSITNRNQYYFGLLNLDATYERRINSKFSLQLQPYLKLPLTNIGYGEVKLQTAGIAVGLSYQIK